MTLRESLVFTPQELDFGTSGLRGTVVDMTDLECYINTLGFLKYLQKAKMVQAGDEILVAGDLRESTPRILKAVVTAIQHADLLACYYGSIPTPALAFSGLLENKACIMVTGSHIPADRNGIKFYKIGGEVLKEDEAAIKNAVANIRTKIYSQNASSSLFDTRGQLKPEVVAEVDEAKSVAAKVYLERYTTAFSDQPLANKEVVVYQHSAVGRDLLVSILEQLGATVVPYGRSETFIPIDTENVTDAEKALFKKLAKEHPNNFAIVSTDGDSDRPFVIDAKGEFYRGDILGCLVADFLKLDYVAIPISSNDAVDTFCANEHIQLVHTMIGSPYVISAMQAAKKYKRPGGWEVNGGFLLAADVPCGQAKLKALPTRDAVLPILVALVSASQKNVSIANLFSRLPQRFTGGGLVDNVPMGKIKKFKSRVAEGSYSRQGLEAALELSPGSIQQIDTTDGLRLIFADGKVVHFRPSGNAPQMRVYTNCDTQVDADAIVTKSVADNGFLERLLHE